MPQRLDPGRWPFERERERETAKSEREREGEGGSEGGREERTLDHQSKESPEPLKPSSPSL